jgi:hypothetical protein
MYRGIFLPMCAGRKNDIVPEAVMFVVRLSLVCSQLMSHSECVCIHQLIAGQTGRELWTVFHLIKIPLRAHYPVPAYVKPIPIFYILNLKECKYNGKSLTNKRGFVILKQKTRRKYC